MTLPKRILHEKRSAVVPLVIGVLVNVGVYALVVHPLSARSASASDRAAAATRARSAAERDLASARTLVASKSRADQELATFYDKVLPAGQSAARDLTYARLPTLAQKAGVRLLQRSSEVDEARLREARLGCLKTRVVLQGDYESIRRFVYDLETAPEFVIIDDVSLAQLEANKPLSLTLALSTYYRLGANGT